MINYIIRRLILLPITLFCIVLVNFAIINLAPGDPVTITEISPEGAAVRKENRGVAFGSDERYLQFREFYGLTLPILFNNWPEMTHLEVKKSLWVLVHHRTSPDSEGEIPFKEYDAFRVNFGDRARFIMPHLVKIMQDPEEDMAIRRMAVHFFIRGAYQQAFLGPHLSEEKKALNRKYARDNNFLRSLAISSQDTLVEMQQKIELINQWYGQNKDFFCCEPSVGQKVRIFFFETRFFRYLSRVVTLDFGTLRNDDNKTVIREVSKRFKYSLTLSIIPMLITFVLCQLAGLLMAYRQNQWQDISLNILFLILYAIPIFVIAPLLIELALNRNFPWTHIPIPISGFTSPSSIYDKETSLGRLFDILQHIALPLVALMYGSLAAQTRLARTAILEVMRQDYVRTALAKGVSPFNIMFKHVGRNSAITIVTSVAGSLGVILGGSLIVETLFEIDGFGKFFYDAVINRDYNVIMFSALAGSFLTVVGYLVADIAYTLLDPRLTLE